MFSFTVVVFISLSSALGHAELLCTRGQYLDPDQQVCLPCPNNTFISHDNHQFVDCQRCSEPDEYQHEIAVKLCTNVSNTIIGCKEGYFRQNHDHYDMVAIGECEKCSVCEYTGMYEVQPCTQFSDTVCCPEPDMVVEPNRKESKCKAMKDGF